jgi:hypothetical protein
VCFEKAINRKERKDRRDQDIPFFVLFAFFAVNIPWHGLVAAAPRWVLCG